MLIAFRRAVGRREVDRSKVQDHLKNVPDVIIEGLLSRFTESTRGSTEFVYFGLDGCVVAELFR